MLNKQFIDVIEYIDESNKLLVHKYDRQDNEIKQGAKLIVRESQLAVFLSKGQLADIFYAGTHTLETNNLPILSTLGAIAHGFNSPIKSDVYFISLKQFVANKWGTPNPVIVRDPELGIVRVRGFGNYAFKVTDGEKFLKEILGTQQKFLTYDIVDYLNSYILESFSSLLGSKEMSVLDFAAQYKTLGDELTARVNQEINTLGLEIVDINIENISVPEEVEKLIDEQSGLGLAKKDMGLYMEYQSSRAMRDAARQEGGMAGIGAGMALGNTLAQTVTHSMETVQVVKIKCPSCGELCDETSKFCSKCGQSFNSKSTCSNCNTENEPGSNFCSGCGNKL